MSLNILLEIVEESIGISSFNIYKNIAVDDKENAFSPHSNWNINFYDSLKPNFDKDELFVISVVGVKSKEHVYKWFKASANVSDSKFINLIHPKAFVSKSVNLNYGLQVEPQSTIAACSSVGFGVNVKRNSSIGHHCEIGDFVTINPGATISSYVQVGRNTMIGSGVSIKDNVKIGDNCIIGVGSVVVKDIPNNSIAYGNPCIVHKNNEKQKRGG